MFFWFYIAFLFLQRLYVGTATKLKRMESESRTPLYNLILETLSGLLIIKTFKVEDNTMAEIDATLLQNNKLNFLCMAGTL